MKFGFINHDENPSLGIGVDRWDNHNGTTRSTGDYYVGYLDLWKFGLRVEVFW